MILDLSSFANQSTTLTEEDVQALADSASSKPMLPGIHEVFVSAVPSEKVAVMDAPNAHLLKFNIKLENVSGETATVYCELPLDPSKTFKIDKDGNENRRAIGRHTKTLLALGVPPGKLGDLIKRVVATNGEALQGLKGFKAKVIITRDVKKSRLEYDADTGAYFLVRNENNERLADEPFMLTGTGKERFAEAEIKARDCLCILEAMAQTEVQALTEVDNDVAALLSVGKIVNKVQGLGTASVKLGTKPVVAAPIAAVVAKPLPKPLPKPMPKPLPKPVVAAPEELPTDEDLEEQTGEDAADYDETEA